MSDLRALLKSYLDSPDLPLHENLLSLLESGISVLESEDSNYRPTDSEGKSGGLIDFSGAEFSSFPVIIAPDLHGRGKFLLDLLDFKPSSVSVLELLEKGEILVCCVGDIFHSENRGRERWKAAFLESMGGNYVNEPLSQEMKENLSLLEMILSLKSAFPSHFHILKGNHENVLNEDNRTKYGNVPFRKFCDEGNMVAQFLQHKYDDLILHEISCFEKSLPICAAFKNCIVSHAEPADFFTRRQIIDYHKNGSFVTFALTWTANDAAKEGSVEHLFIELLPETERKNAFYFSGHRPVMGKYALRQNGRLVQFHNPELEQIVLINGTEKFNPDKDIIEVGR